MRHVVGAHCLVLGERHSLVLGVQLRGTALAALAGLVLRLLRRRVILEDFLSMATHLGTDASTNMLRNFLPVFPVDSDSYSHDKED